MTTTVQIVLIICGTLLAALGLALHYGSQYNNRKDDEE